MRVTPLQTLGGLYFDSLGPGISNFSATVICGIERGLDGYTGLGRLQALKNMVLVSYATGLSTSDDLSKEYVTFYLPPSDISQEISLELIITSLSENTNVSMPLCPIVTISGIVMFDNIYSAPPPLPQFGVPAGGSSSGGSGSAPGAGEVQYSQRSSDGSYH